MMKLTREQHDCPYCHEQADHYAEPISGDFNDIGCGLIHADSGWYMASWDYDNMQKADDPAVACPMCDRDLRSDER